MSHRKGEAGCRGRKGLAGPHLCGAGCGLLGPCCCHESQQMGGMRLGLPKAEVGDVFHGEDTADDGNGLREFSCVYEL